MSWTTPPRPVDVEVLFPELAGHRGTTTRLHPRPGAPGVRDSSVGGPLLWPADEPWPVCPEPHPHGRGRRPRDVHRARRIRAAARRRDPAGLTDDELRLLDKLDAVHRYDDIRPADPLPLIGVAQLHRRDVPDLLPGPDGSDLLQLFWCPFDAHGPTGAGMHVEVRWHRSDTVGAVLADPPRPEVVGFDGYLPEPCAVHPEQVTTYPFAGLLPAALEARIDAREEALDEAEDDDDFEDDEDVEDGPGGAGGPDDARYQYDLSIPPGWRAGGHASWHLTDPAPMDCRACRTPMRLLLTVDSSEWDGGTGSWTPLEEAHLPPHPHASPTAVTVGRWGELNIFACPADPAHPPRWSIQ